MKKLNTSPISGMQELLPPAQATFNRLKTGIATVFHRHGYQNIETPVIDRTEILLAKAGGDTEKQIYKVFKTAETADEADQALRFDHTVPLARYVVEHQNDLPFPFKVSQVGRNFRGERAQKARFREFYQCDIDVIGRKTLSLAYDADVIATLVESLGVFKLPAIKVRVSNRQILSGLLEELNLNHIAKDIFNIVDHAEKVPATTTKQRLLDLHISEDHIDTLLGFMQIRGDSALKELRALDIQNERFAQGVDELENVIKILAEMAGAEPSSQAGSVSGMRVVIEADMLIVRGLDYYTGTVFETFVPGYEGLGSICSGGRYEQLASHYTEQILPGVGGSIGLTRLFAVLREAGLLAEKVEPPIKYALIPISENEYEFAFRLAKRLRLEEPNCAVDVILTGKKLGTKMTYAARVSRYGIVIGEDEVKSGKLSVKDFATGEAKELKI